MKPEIVDQSKFQALADNKINATEKFKFVLGMVENILGKRRSLLPQGRQKSGLCGKELKPLPNIYKSKQSLEEDF